MASLCPWPTPTSTLMNIHGNANYNTFWILPTFQLHANDHGAQQRMIYSSSLSIGNSFPRPLSLKTKTKMQARAIKAEMNVGIPLEKAVKSGKQRDEDVASTSQNNKPIATRVTEEVMNSVKVLKAAAKTRKAPVSEVASAFRVLRRAKLDASNFLDTLGGNESPGRTWMLIFTAQGRSGKGYYFPVTAVQRFDAAAMKIENGIYLGPIGFLTFEGRFSWKKRILAFIFEHMNLRLGPLGPFKINLVKENKGRTPGTQDPFFIWFYVDEEIAVAQGRGGGTALWCRCTKVT